jgi:hypothetical protein
MKEGSLLRVALIGAAVTFGGSMLAPSALADSITFDLFIPNSAVTGTGPYVSVIVDRTSTTTATITFNSLNNGGFEYLMGATGAADVNVNATSFTESALTGSNSFAGFTPGPLTNGGSGNVDGFGVFNQTNDSFDGFTHSSTQISFTLTNNSGTWANASSVLVQNASGFSAAAHVFGCANPCTVGEGATFTGFVAVPGPTVGAGLPALVMACGGLLVLARRRREKIV